MQSEKTLLSMTHWVLRYQDLEINLSTSIFNLKSGLSSPQSKKTWWYQFRTTPELLSVLKVDTKTLRTQKNFFTNQMTSSNAESFVFYKDSIFFGRIYTQKLDFSAMFQCRVLHDISWSAFYLTYICNISSHYLSNTMGPFCTWENKFHQSWHYWADKEYSWLC